MPNIKSKISTHNKKMLNKPVNENTQKCYCINKSSCPVNANCFVEKILYIATTTCGKKNFKPSNNKGISENIQKTIRVS